MRVAHGGARVGMAEHFLNFVKGMAGIDEKTGECVPQVMDAHVIQAKFAAQFFPEQVQI